MNKSKKNFDYCVMDLWLLTKEEIIKKDYTIDKNLFAATWYQNGLTRAQRFSLVKVKGRINNGKRGEKIVFTLTEMGYNLITLKLL